MKIPLGLAKKLLKLSSGERIPKSQLSYSAIQGMIDDDVIKIKITGRSKKHLFVPKPENLHNYIKNHFGINDLAKYVKKLEEGNLTRSENVEIASNSKLTRARTFKGFPVNCYQPIEATLNNKPIVIEPREGLFTFIYDFEQFVPNADVTIIGIENSENFRYVEKQIYLFSDYKPLFVSRYPQSKDLREWLFSISNKYLHFGDFDFQGINIYHNEFKKYLKERSTFFIPGNIEALLKSNGNRVLYDRQLNSRIENITDDGVSNLLSLMHKYKKCLEQEIFVK
ncbi:MAG TPA: hypothetical protein G4N96_13615 [Chloroflexi bacterium]|nr:hypothetical protein [Chloroflexota bacterium]